MKARLLCCFGVCLGSVNPSCARSPEAAGQGRPPAPPAVQAGPGGAATAPEPGPTAPDTTDPVAVVELFTSEGCSSCPSADQTLARIERWRQDTKSNVITLAFHVDYWNRLGWRDRFSDRAYSDRQRWYALREAEPRLYTPQMIVQGTRSFVGSHEAEARAAIRAALDSPPKLAVGLSTERVEHGTWLVRYRIEPARPQDHLSLVLVQERARSQVTAGENAGENLTHVSIVLGYVSKTVDSGRGSWRVEPPATERLSVVGIVQSPSELAVLGANRAPLE